MDKSMSQVVAKVDQLSDSEIDDASKITGLWFPETNFYHPPSSIFCAHKYSSMVHNVSVDSLHEVPSATLLLLASKQTLKSYRACWAAA